MEAEARREREHRQKITQDAKRRQGEERANLRKIAETTQKCPNSSCA